MPALWLFTDPVRTPDPAALMRRLPRGAGVVFRAFGAGDAEATGHRLSRIARARGLVLLVGADEGLAEAIGAHGVHLPERLMGLAPRLRARRPHWLVTAAAHNPAALARAGRLGLDAAFLSAAFDSDSSSAGPAIGPARLAALVRAVKVRVVALGGVDARTAPRLADTGVWGLAAIGGFLDA